MEVRQDNSEETERILCGGLPILGWQRVEPLFQHIRGAKADQCRLVLGIPGEEVAAPQPQDIIMLRLDRFAQEVQPGALPVSALGSARASVGSPTERAILGPFKTKGMRHTLHSFRDESRRH